MGDPLYTDAQLKDGTTLRFNGQLNPNEVADKVAAYRTKSAPMTISAHKNTMWEQMKDAVPALKGDWIHNPMPFKDMTQLAYPERVYTPSEQEQHPVRTAVDQAVGSLTSPENLLVLHGMQGLGGLASKAISGGFAVSSVDQAIDARIAAKQAEARGDVSEAKRLNTHAIIGLGMAGLAGTHTIKASEEFSIPGGAAEETKISQVPLARSEGTPSPAKAAIAQELPKTTAPTSQTGESLLSAKELSKPYGPPKEDFHGNVPKENLGFNPNPAEDFGNKVRSEVERRMGGPLQRGQVEQRAENLDTKLADAFAKGKNDTDYFQQAKEQLGKDASISEIAKKAQDIKSQRGSSTLAASPFGLAFEAKGKLENFYQEKVAEPLIQNVLKLGRTYPEVEKVDSEFAEKLRTLDHGAKYYQQKADSIIKSVVGDLSRDQERLFVLMADRDSRFNLMMNHPDEYQQAALDPAIREALNRYKPQAKLLGQAHEELGGTLLNNYDYLHRVYPERVGGIGAAPKAREVSDVPFDRAIKPQQALSKQRILDAEEYYKEGLHEFGPSFGKVYTPTMVKVLRDRVARDFLSKATVIERDDTLPGSINFKGKQYFSPDVAADMRARGEKTVSEYGIYNAGPRFYTFETEGIDHSISSTDPVKKTKLGITSDKNRYIAPKELTDAMNGFDAKNEGQASEVKRFFQEQIVGLGFGIPHYKNIMRRVSQSAPMGIANPVSWVRMYKLAFNSELKARALSGLEDPMFDTLAKQGAISTDSQVSQFKKYIGGNLNPANWVRPLAKVGHDFLFDAGGVDQRARLQIGDLVKSQHPEYSDSRIAQAVNEQLGNYNKKNWTDMQRGVGKFLLFPGWDLSSAAWVIRHPIKTSIPTAMTVFLANRTINALGGNSESDKNDMFAIHIGGRTIQDNLLNEPLARVAGGTVIRGAEAIIQHKSWDRAVNESAKEFAKDVGKPVTMLRPDLTLLPELRVNKDFATGQPVYGDRDWNKPGTVFPNKMLDKMALYTVGKMIPQVGNIINAQQNGKFDVLQFLGSNLGVYNYPKDPVSSLKSKLVSGTTFLQAKGSALTPAQAARALHSDPDATVFVAFRPAIETKLKEISNIDSMRLRVDASNAPQERKDYQYKQLDKQRDAMIAQAKLLDAAIEKTLKNIHERK